MAMINPTANPMQQIQQLMQRQSVAPQPPVDPRSAAIEQYMQQQGDQSRMATIQPNTLMMQQQAGPGMQDDQGGMHGDPLGDEGQSNLQNATRREMHGQSPAEEDADMEDQLSDEQLLDHVHQGITPGETLQQRENRQTDRPQEQDWPPTPEEFEKQFGRPPTTDSEMEFYYGSQDDDDSQEQATDTRGR